MYKINIGLCVFFVDKNILKCYNICMEVFGFMVNKYIKKENSVRKRDYMNLIASLRIMPFIDACDKAYVKVTRRRNTLIMDSTFNIHQHNGFTENECAQIKQYISTHKNRYFNPTNLNSNKVVAVPHGSVVEVCSPISKDNVVAVGSPISKGNVVAVGNPTRITYTHTLDKDDKVIIQQFKRTMAYENNLRKQLNLPKACYDKETKRAYLEYPDGRREYVGNET